MDDLHRDALADGGQPCVDDSHSAGTQPPDQPKRTDLGRIVIEQGGYSSERCHSTPLSGEAPEVER